MFSVQLFGPPFRLFGTGVTGCFKAEMDNGRSKSTISRVLKSEQKLRGEWALRENAQGTSHKRKREGKEAEVEDALNQWFAKVTTHDVAARGVHISGPILKAKAEDLAKKLGHDEFKATDGWLSRWKSRHEIKFKKAHGEKGSADADGVEKWKSSKLPELLKQFCADDIYNADETGLYYRATPDGSLCYKHETLVGSKKEMDRITVLCCSNMSGSDKRKLLVIGQSAKPRCFKGLRMDGLPVLYHANKNAWMTSEIFSKWLSEWDVELQRKSKKILLLLDNCAAHPHLDSLKNIQLEFLPPNTTSILEPMDMGIIKNLKTLHRGKLVSYILEAIEENLLQESSTVTDVSGKINILQAIQFVADSWREISQSTLQNCFAHHGWKNSEQSETRTDSNYVDETTLQVQSVENYEEFISIDDNIECYNENEDCDDVIVEEIAVKREETTDNQETDKANAHEEIEQMTHCDARKFIAGL
ncbi:tigger transposable element-derived protein 6-like [Erpetoichthys calabaricus]|uniref:tigger transposable element-derived protein 6-like n=1 Tax=Erpetoichthys calabaricus TaxID=27687 RepID=UPI002234ADF0|nr:tigger transposable element-derived protein 6-like [Erpetoichthys calabaricus]